MRRRASSRSCSDAAPTSMRASPAVAWGTKTCTSPSPRPAQKSATSGVRSMKVRPAESTLISTESMAHHLPPAWPGPPATGPGSEVRPHPTGRITEEPGPVPEPQGRVETMSRSGTPTGPRCPWAEGSDAMRRYHDEEWGVPSDEDRNLFEMLILEGAQAGLSWSTILNKRDGYRLAFDGFDPARVARYQEEKLDELLGNPGIVRNRLKVRGTVT